MDSRKTTLAITPLDRQGALRMARRWQQYPVEFYKPLFQMACAEEQEIRGVCVVGAPRAMAFSDGWTVEAEAFAQGGEKRAIGMMLEAAWAAARALGYKRMLLAGEPVYLVKGYERGAPLPPAADGPRYAQTGFVDWERGMGGYAERE